MGQDVVHGVDAAEVIGIEHVLPARTRLRLRADMLLQESEHRVEHVDDRHAEPMAGLFQIVAQGLVDDGGQHRAGVGLDAFQHAMQLEAGPDQAPAMVLDTDSFELGHRRAGDAVESLAGRVRDQMQVDTVLHNSEDNGDNSGLAGVADS